MNTIFWAVVVLGALIFVHELGHFLAARFYGVRVLTFSLGFGPRIWGYQQSVKTTEYRLSVVPLGGYVKMLGDSEEEDEEIPPEDAAFAFSAQPVGPRIAIVCAGPMFNFLFAVVALCGAYMLGIHERLAVVGMVQDDMPAKAAGIQPGDVITHVGTRAVDRWETMSQAIKALNGDPVTLTVLRGEKAFELTIRPQVKEMPNLFGEPVKLSLIGITPGEATALTRYDPWTALVKGAGQTWSMIDMTLTSIWKLITRVVSADQIGGPIMIAELAGKTAEQGATNLLFFMALISVNLGILNLLPIPILDGGHLAFFLVEMAKGTPVSERFRLLANRFGMAVLGGLMVLAFYNDLVRVFAEH
ncbi:MAG: RIP metalloprotease RseP [Magnetococcales bacterium]|nr:RIP metalloprotease RseP [Magnetococcales bacterium]